MPVNLDEMNGADPLVAAYKAHGITPDYLARKAKKLLNAKITKSQKLKGNVKGDLPKGFKVVARTNYKSLDKEGNYRDSDSEILIQWKEDDHGTQQKAQITAEQHLGLARPQKLEHSGKVVNELKFTPEQIAQFMPLVKARGKALEDEHIKSISGETP